MVLRELCEGLWEIRMRGRKTIARAIYVPTEDRRLVVVRAFLKTTRKTPRSELKLALERTAGLAG